MSAFPATRLRRLRRTHTLPEDPSVLRQGGRAMRAMRRDQAPEAADPADDLVAQWRRHASQARRLHEKLFYSRCSRRWPGCPPMTSG